MVNGKEKLFSKRNKIDGSTISSLLPLFPYIVLPMYVCMICRSRLASLYNDKSVLENHHLSSAFELMKSSERNIVTGLKTEQYREFRSLVIDMVLATDMSSHFTQIKNMKSLLSCPEKLVYLYPVISAATKTFPVA